MDVGTPCPALSRPRSPAGVLLCGHPVTFSPGPGADTEKAPSGPHHTLEWLGSDDPGEEPEHTCPDHQGHTASGHLADLALPSVTSIKSLQVFYQ